MTRPRVLLISYDAVGEEMAGLGIRTFELARVLAGHADVTVAHGGRSEGDFDGIPLVIERLIAAVVHGIAPCAVTGEAESPGFPRTPKGAGGRRRSCCWTGPVYCGIGRASIVETRRLIDEPPKIGASPARRIERGVVAEELTLLYSAIANVQGIGAL